MVGGWDAQSVFATDARHPGRTALCPAGVFAGVIVSTLLKRAQDVPGALGSNILGSVVGGCLEYLSMYAGLRKMTLLAMALYLTAYLILARQAAQPEAAEAALPREADA